MAQEYRSIDNPSITRRLRRLRCCGIRRKKVFLLFSIILGFLCLCLYHINNSIYKRKYIKSYPKKSYNITVNEIPGLLFIKGKPRRDKYGLDLNVNILDGIYTVGYNNDPHASVEDWDLYTPPCPNLRPVKFPESVINPKCEGNSLQFADFRKDNGADLPSSIRLDSITNQLKKFKEWKKNDGENPMYGERRVSEIIGSDYHPFDYGYTGEDTESMEDTEFYNNVITSHMDEVPDPRRRRIFSFIMFNGEFDLLDLYLAEYYEIMDYFVIYESNTTFTNNPKPLYFTRALFETDRYDRFKDKLIPLPCETLVHEDNGRGIGFPKEHVARRVVIEKGLKSVQARHGDIFMHGDLDEMPKVHVLARMKKCGGWEHLQAGIGGAPKSFKDPKTKSYFFDKDMDVRLNHNGVYQVDYERHLSVGFFSWFYEYSFGIMQNKTVPTMAHPNVSIFDARRSLGQLPDFINKQPGFSFPKIEKVEDNNTNETVTDNQKRHLKREEAGEGEGEGEKKDNEEDEYKDLKFVDHYDPLSDPNFDPFQGYSYSDNTNDRKTGKGYLGEFNRFVTSELAKASDAENPLIWNSAWHVSSFLPTLEHFYNKISSYSHFVSYGKRSKQEILNDVIYRIKNHFYIYGNKNKYEDNVIYYPDSYSQGYDYNFDYNYWEKNVKSETPDESFMTYVDNIKREIPFQVWKNPICYNFMIDRDYGLEKKLWWQIVPKKDWKTIKFDQLNEKTINELIPKEYPESLKKQYINN